MADPTPGRLTAPTDPLRFEPPDNWIPVDKRRWGLDRRTVLPAAIVAVIVLALLIVPSTLNSAVGYDDPVRSGDVIALQGGVTVTPPAGWNIESGFREGKPGAGGKYPPKAKLTDSGAVVAITTAPFTGTSDELFRQITSFEKAIAPESPTVSDGNSAVVTRDGHRGVVGGYTGAGTDGVLAAVAANGVGVEVVAVTPKQVNPAVDDDVTDIIESLTISGGTP